MPFQARVSAGPIYCDAMQGYSLYCAVTVNIWIPRYSDGHSEGHRG